MVGGLHCGLTSPFSFLPGLPISTYARYCYRKLQKVAVTGGKKVSVCPGCGLPVPRSASQLPAVGPVAPGAQC